MFVNDVDVMDYIPMSLITVTTYTPNPCYGGQ